MKEYTLVGVDGNAWSVMAYVTRAMKDAYKEASTPDSDGQVAEIAMKDFGKEAQAAYTKDATSSDYNHLLCVSMDMIDRVNQYFEEEGYDLESDDDDDYDDYYDDDYDDYYDDEED